MATLVASSRKRTSNVEHTRLSTAITLSLPPSHSLPPFPFGRRRGTRVINRFSAIMSVDVFTDDSQQSSQGGEKLDWGFVVYVGAENRCCDVGGRRFHSYVYAKLFSLTSTTVCNCAVLQVRFARPYKEAVI